MGKGWGKIDERSLKNKEWKAKKKEWEEKESKRKYREDEWKKTKRSRRCRFYFHFNST